MWKPKQTIIEPDRITKFEIWQEDKPLTFAEVIDGWIKEDKFSKFYTSVLATHKFEAFFWEHPPMTKSQLNNIYEFVLVESNALVQITARPQAFEQYFTEAKKVVSFPNLRGDAQLIVPAPIVDQANYGHLAKFLRNAPSAQIHEFWQKIGRLYQDSIDTNTVWLSTAGLGVSWLHVRIDNKPKYYRYPEYKQHK